MNTPESLFDSYKEAVLQKDLEAYLSLFDEELRVFDMWQQWSYEGLQAWRDMAKAWFDSLGENRDLVTFDNIQIQSATTDMAVASAFMKFTAVSATGEALRYLENRLTWVMRKSDSGWKIIHQHTSVPIHLETIQGILQR